MLTLWPLISSILLLCIGILVIYSSSPSLSLQQLLFAVIGLFFYFLISKLDYTSFKSLSKPLMFITFVLLILVFILGFETRGSVRWIPLGLFNIQPSEFAKPALIIFLATFWSIHKPTW